MRASIDFTVSATDVDEMKGKVVAEWQRLVKNKNAELPPGTEIRMQQHTENDFTYKVNVTIRTKLGE